MGGHLIREGLYNLHFWSFWRQTQSSGRWLDNSQSPASSELSAVNLKITIGGCAFFKLHVAATNLTAAKTCSNNFEVKIFRTILLTLKIINLVSKLLNYTDILTLHLQKDRNYQQGQLWFATKKQKNKYFSMMVCLTSVTVMYEKESIEHSFTMYDRRPLNTVCQ